MPPEKEQADKMDVDETPKNSDEKKDAFPPFENDPEILTKIQDAIALIDEDGVQSAIDKLLTLERINRGAGAAPETATICVNIVRMFGKKEDWKTLSEYTVLLSKRRAQLKMAIHRMVQEAMSYLDVLPDEATKLALLDTLRDVTSGKIFVELERARLTRTLADMKVAKGDIEGAATIMQEVQVETFSGMERKEKFDFILEQVRLCLERNDFIRGAIISKKIMPRQLNRDGLFDIKMQFYATIIRIHMRNTEYLEICIAYLERFETCKKLEEKDWMRELKLASLFVVLSPRDSKQSDLLHRIQTFKAMEELPTFAELLKLFSTNELIRWPVLMTQYKEDIAALMVPAKEEMKDEDVKWEKALQERVTEHNLRVLSKYYSRIRLQRLAELLDMSEDDTERKLAAMVSDKKALWAKIDRPARIVSFAKPKDANAVLNGWADNVSSLLDIVEKTCHLVHRETMVHAIGTTKIGQ